MRKTMLNLWGLVLLGTLLSTSDIYAASGNRMRVHKLLPVADGVLLAGHREHRFLVQALHSDGSVNTGFGVNGEWSLGPGLARDLVAVDGGFMVIGQSNGEDLVLRLDASGQPDSQFGQMGIQVLPLQARLLAYQSHSHQLLIVGAGHQGFDWLTLEVDSGQVHDRARVRNPVPQRFRYWTTPTLLLSADDGWLIGARQSNGDYQAQGVFRLHSNQSLDSDWGQQGYLPLPALHQLWGLDWQNNTLSALGETVDGHTWLRHFDTMSRQQGDPSNLHELQDLSVMSAALKNGQLLVVDEQASHPRLWTQPLKQLGEPVGAVVLPNSLSLDLVEMDDERIWFAGEVEGRYFVGQIDMDALGSLPSGSDDNERLRRASEDCATVSTAGNVCLGVNSCMSHTGIKTRVKINNELNNLISTNFTSNIRFYLDSEIVTIANLQSHFKSRIVNEVDSTFIFKARTALKNGISTDVEAEAATAELQLQGKYELDSRIATAEIQADVKGKVVTTLSLELAGVSTALSAKVTTNADIKADVAGVKASVGGSAGSAASGSALGGIVLGTLGTLGVIGFKVVVVPALQQRMGDCCRGVWNALRGAILTAVLGPCGTLIERCCR